MRLHNLPTRTILAASLAAFVLLAASGGGVLAKTKKPPKISPVSMIVGGAVDLPIFCYLTTQEPENLNIYKKAGLNVTLEGLTGATSALELLATGQSDLAISAPSSFADLAAQGSIPTAKMVYLQEPGPGWTVVVAPSSTITSVSDLKGQTIGVEGFGISTYPAMQQMLTEVGINPTTGAKFLATGAGAPAQLALENGTVQALAVTSYELAALENTGLKFRQIPLTSEMQKTSGLAIAASDAFIQSEPKVLTAFLQAVTKGLIMMQENPTACTEMQWKAYPEGKPLGVTNKVALQQSLREVNAQSADFKAAPGDQLGYFPPAVMATTFKVYGGKIGASALSDVYTNAFVKGANAFNEKAWAKSTKTIKIG